MARNRSIVRKQTATSNIIMPDYLINVVPFNCFNYRQHRSNRNRSSTIEALSKCIRHHQDIARCYRRLENLFSPMLLFKFGLATFQICVLLLTTLKVVTKEIQINTYSKCIPIFNFNSIRKLEQTHTEFLLDMQYLFFVVTDVFLYCATGQILFDQVF